jgi:hypothetical protein
LSLITYVLGCFPDQIARQTRATIGDLTERFDVVSVRRAKDQFANTVMSKSENRDRTLLFQSLFNTDSQADTNILEALERITSAHQLLNLETRCGGATCSAAR